MEKNGKFSYTFSAIIPCSTCEQLLTWICYCVSKEKQVLIGYFRFLFWLSSAILLSKMKSLFLNLYNSSQWVTGLLQLPMYRGKYALIYKLKRFLLVKPWYTIWTYGGFKLQSNNIKKQPSHMYSFWNCISFWNHSLYWQPYERRRVSIVLSFRHFQINF